LICILWLFIMSLWIIRDCQNSRVATNLNTYSVYHIQQILKYFFNSISNSNLKRSRCDNLAKVLVVRSN
jgi:hypothetical protein